MLHAVWAPYTLHFKETAITSRARMLTKDTYIIKVWDDASPEIVGWGECPLFRGLSAEDTPDYEAILTEACRNISDLEGMPQISSIRFGFEMALNDLASGGTQKFYSSSWAKGETTLKINGLIWMGDRDTMARRIEDKLRAGFKCVKLKIGGIDFEKELELLRLIRNRFSPEEIELRLDANGAFTPDNALERLTRLAEFQIHSIEQPIKAGQINEMARIAALSPIPVALDEELIGFYSNDYKHRLLNKIAPSYIILKPSLCGGFKETDRWIDIALEKGIGWWATSALESDLGLAAIGQWVSLRDPEMPQGLGTGQLYTNNIKSPIFLNGETLGYNPYRHFIFPELDWHI